MVFPQLPNFLYNRVQHTFSLPLIVPELFRGAKSGKLVAEVLGGICQATHYFGIGDVAAIPCEQVIHPVHSCDRNVESVFDRFAGIRPFSRKRLASIWLQ
jgi:hypothetical protein